MWLLWIWINPLKHQSTNGNLKFIDQSSGETAVSVFCKVELWLLLKESGDFEERVDGNNSFIFPPELAVQWHGALKAM